MYHHCEAGQWSEEPGLTRCMCESLGSSHQGDVLCHPPVAPGEAVASGTYCLHTCHGHTKTEMMCQHSLWSHHPDSLTCESSGNLTDFAAFRGKSLEMNKQMKVEMMTTKENLGSMALRKLAEMKTNDAKKPLMRTKVNKRSYMRHLNQTFSAF